jgi:O-antigen/teichoic acid export membrane protein
MRRRLPWADLAFLLALLLLPLLIFAPVALGSKTLLPIDALYLDEPYRSEAPAVGVDEVQNPLLGDLILQNYAWQRFIVESVGEGVLPLWDPYLFAGHPFFAGGQHSLLYPLRVIFHLFPLPRAYGLFIALQLGLAGIWSYVLGRVLGGSRLGAFLAGITFQFSGFLVVSAVHPMIVAGASWLPLLLALVDLTVRRAPFAGRGRAMLPWALLGALALGMQMLAGHAEITYFALLVTGAFAAWRLAHAALTRQRSEWRAELLSPALGVALLFVLGLSLGAVQFVPFYELASTSFRQDAVTLEQVLGWAYPKRRVITFLVPNFFGNPTHRAVRHLFTGEWVLADGAFDWGIKNYVEGGAYVGVLTLLLAAVAVLKPPVEGSERRLAGLRRWLAHPYVPFFTFLSLFSLGAVFGTPLYALVYALPFINQSHSPFRWVFPLTVALAALAGLGATTVAQLRRTRGPDYAEGEGPEPDEGRAPWPVRLFLLDTRPNVVSVVGVTAIWAGALALVGLWASRLAFGAVEPVVERLYLSLAKAPDVFPDARTFYSYEFVWLQKAALMLVASGIVLRVSRCPIYLFRKSATDDNGSGTSPSVSSADKPFPAWRGRVPAWGVLAVLVLLADLVTFGAPFNPRVDASLLDHTPPGVEFLKGDASLWRLSTFEPSGAARVLNPNTGMFYDLQDVRGYDSLFSAQYARYMSWIEPQGMLPYNRIAPFRDFPSLDSPLTDLLNVKYVLSTVEIPLPKYRQVYRDGAVRVYENLGAMPRAFTLPQTATLYVRDVEAVGEAVLDYDPRFYAIVEEDPAGWSTGEPRRSSASAEAAEPRPQPVTAYGRNEVWLDAHVDSPSWLVLADSYYPGWKAFVRPRGGGDGEEFEVPIARVAGNFRGVTLDEGEWTVRFKYSPNSVKFGAFVSFLGGMTVLFLAGVWGWRRLYREEGERSAAQRIAKNSVAPIALTLFNRVLDLAFAMLMLRILGPANAGDYYYAASIFMWFDIVTNFGLDAYLTREVARHPGEARRYLLNTTAVRLGLSAVGLPLLVGFVFLRQTALAALAAPASTQAIVALALLYLGLVPGSVSKGLTSLFYGFEKAEYPAAITTFTTLLRVTSQTLVLLAGWGVVGLAATTVGINAVTLAVLAYLAWRLFPVLREEARRWSDAALRRAMLVASWALMLNHLLATLFFKVDVFLVEMLRGSTVVGFYSIGYKLLEALNVIPAMFTLAVFPVLSRQAAEDEEAFLRFYRLGVKILVALALPAALLSTLAAREMVLVLGGPQYLPDSMIALQLMAWSMPIGWMNSLTNYVLIALDQQRYLTRAYAIAFTFNLVANLALIPVYGYLASAALHIFSELVLFIAFAVGMRRQVGRVGWQGIVEKPLLATLAMGAVALGLLPVGRWAALLGALITYPLAAWRLGLLTAAERGVLAPLLRRS